MLYSFYINLGILFISIFVIFFIIKKTKFEDNNYKILFVVYILFWISPMLLREYTAPMYNHRSINVDPTSLWLIPLMITYGIVSLFCKPLTEILVFKIGSRKKIIYYSLLFQFICFLPMFIYPCVTTNFIQSIGCGVGASCLGLFNLMFNEQYAKKRMFLTVTLLSIPPIIAEFISSIFQSLITSIVPKSATASDYINIVKWLWFIGILILLITAFVTYFVKEDRKCLYIDRQYKIPVNSLNNWIIIILLCVIALFTSFIKFTTCGPVSITQMQFIGARKCGYDGIINGWDGYLSTVFSIGQIIGNIMIGYVLLKKMNKLSLSLIGCVIWLIFVILYSTIGIANPIFFLLLNILNGLSFGIIYNIIVNMVISRYFAKIKNFNPIDLYNTSLSIGIICSTSFNSFMNKDVVFSEFWKILNEAQQKKQININDDLWSKFITTNWIVNILIMGIICIIVVLFIFIFYIDKKSKLKQMISDNEQNIVIKIL